MALTALFFSICSCFCASQKTGEPQIANPYSRWGWINAWYKVVIDSTGRNLPTLHNIPVALTICFVTFLICGLKFRYWSKTIPKYVTLSLELTWCPLMLAWTCIGVPFIDGWIVRIEDFFGFIVSLFTTIQFEILSVSASTAVCKSSRLLFWINKHVSSAYNLGVHSTVYWKSFTYMMYNSGPNIEPCGTPTDISFKLELVM